MQEMQENTHIPSSENTSPESVVEKPALPPKTKKSPWVGFIAVLGLLLAMASAVGLVYAWLQYQALLTKTHEKITALETALTKEDGAIADQHALLTDLKKTTQQLQDQIQQQKKPEDWLLAEVDYLVKLAALNLTVDNNVGMAKKLLQAADQQLADANNAAYLPIRQALSNDMATIDAQPQLDLPGVIVRLNTLKQWVEKLPQVPTIKAPEQPEASPVPAAVTLGDKAKNLAMQVWQSLKQLVVIRYDESQSAPLLPPDAFAFVIANIQSQLTMAQWAALHHQNLIYQQSINLVKSGINRYFAADDARVKVAQGLLGNLAAIDVSPKTPDLSQSLQAIQKLLQPSQADDAS